MTSLKCFKSYDIRGKLGDELNEEIAYRIGRAYTDFIKPSNVVVGGDVRLSSESLKSALSEGIRDSGADVIDLGMVGTEQVYFATAFLEAGGGIEVTASHNPINYNGMKLVRENSKPISSNTGLNEIKMLAEKKFYSTSNNVGRGAYKKVDILADYIKSIVSHIDLESVRSLKLVMNSGNGSAGPVIDALESYFQQHQAPISLVKVNNKPDGSFPNGIPNPILEENRETTINAVIVNNADLGIAWDGDFDRCFLIDETGRFIEGYYIVGLLAKAFLAKESGGKIVHDPRLIWNTIDISNKYGGKAIQSKTGHAFFKEKMREENAVYGGEMSAHHYFRDFYFCDSGMIPWLLVVELMSKTNMPLSELVDSMIMRFPSPGEINRKIKDPMKTIGKIKNHFMAGAKTIDETDGISIEFTDWRFNLRASNTEPLVRLNLETRNDPKLMQARTLEVLNLLDT